MVLEKMNHVFGVFIYGKLVASSASSLTLFVISHWSSSSQFDNKLITYMTDYFFYLFLRCLFANFSIKLPAFLRSLKTPSIADPCLRTVLLKSIC